MTERPTLAVVGATGAVGGQLLRILSTREDIWGEIRLISARRTPVQRLTVRGEQTQVLPLSMENLEGVDVALFDVPDRLAEEWVPAVAGLGTQVVDYSGVFRLDPDVPLVVPELNPHDVQNRPRGIVASPCCTTVGMIVSIGALHHAYELESLFIATYQAASGAGQPGIDALYDQVAKVAGHREIGTHAGDVRRVVGEDLGPFPAPLAYNVVPWAGKLRDGGWTSDELMIRHESRKILGLPRLAVSATCVRVPVVSVHSAVVHARFGKVVDLLEVREMMRDSPGLVLNDEPEREEFPTPADVVGTDPTWVGRLRISLDDPKALDLFICADNLRKGAALNMIQIAELLVDTL